MAEYFNLTTIRQHLDESGEIAVEMLLSRLANPNRTVQISKLPLEIIERGTV
jgi:LacI family transcriptional regulator